MFLFIRKTIGREAAEIRYTENLGVNVKKIHIQKTHGHGGQEISHTETSRPRRGRGSAKVSFTPAFAKTKNFACKYTKKLPDFPEV